MSGSPTAPKSSREAAVERIRAFNDMRTLTLQTANLSAELVLHQAVLALRQTPLIVLLEVCPLPDTVLDQLRQRLVTLQNEYGGETFLVFLYTSSSAKTVSIIPQHDDPLDVTAGGDQHKLSPLDQVLREYKRAPAPPQKLRLDGVYKELDKFKDLERWFVLHIPFTDSVLEKPDIPIFTQNTYSVLLFNLIPNPFHTITTVTVHKTAPDYAMTLFRRLPKIATTQFTLQQGRVIYDLHSTRVTVGACPPTTGLLVRFMCSPNDPYPQYARVSKSRLVYDPQKPFNVGALRIAFQGIQDNNRSVIIKQFKNYEWHQFANFFDTISMQLKAKYLAVLFNEYCRLVYVDHKDPTQITMEELQQAVQDVVDQLAPPAHPVFSSFAPAQASPPSSQDTASSPATSAAPASAVPYEKVEFLPLNLFIQVDQKEAGLDAFVSNHADIETVHRLCDGKQLFFVEPQLPSFTKYNSNTTFVNYDEYSAAVQCFSHFTYFITQKQMVVVDLQGTHMAADRRYTLTDPVVLCQTPALYFFAFTNSGQTSIETFFSAHRCNQMCLDLHLPPVPGQNPRLYTAG